MELVNKLSVFQEQFGLSLKTVLDLLIGSEDYKVRSYTRDPARANKGEELKELEDELKGKASAQDVS